MKEKFGLKDKRTEALREKIFNHVPKAVETESAMINLTTLSFKSCLFNNRHVWIDTDVCGQQILELEDLSIEQNRSIDGVVFRLVFQDDQSAMEVITN